MTNSPAKMAEPIVMPFRMMTQVGPRNYVFDWGPEPHTRRRNFEGEKELAQDKVTQQGAELACCRCSLGCTTLWFIKKWQYICNH